MKLPAWNNEINRRKNDKVCSMCVGPYHWFLLGTLLKRDKTLLTASNLNSLFIYFTHLTAWLIIIANRWERFHSRNKTKKNNYNFNSVCCVCYQKQPYSNLPNAKNNGMNLTILLTLALRTRQFWIVNLICWVWPLVASFFRMTEKTK